MRAIETYEPERGLHFSTYALPWIRQRIQRWHMDTGKPVRLPIYLQELQKLYNRTRHRHPEWSEKRVEDYIISRHKRKTGNNLSRKILRKAIHHNNNDVYVHIDNNKENEGDNRVDTIPARPVKNNNLENFAEMFGVLTYREQYILMERAEGKTLEDIAPELGVTRERVRQIEKAAIKKVRANAKIKTRRT